MVTRVTINRFNRTGKSPYEGGRRAYPVVCELTTGQLKYDNFGGRWGETTKLDGFLQAYACEKAKLEARRQGHAVIEQPLADGSIKLTIHVIGSAA